jgi:hypothetical protein
LVNVMATEPSVSPSMVLSDAVTSSSSVRHAPASADVSCPPEPPSVLCSPAVFPELSFPPSCPAPPVPAPPVPSEEAGVDADGPSLCAVPPSPLQAVSDRPAATARATPPAGTNP